MNFMSLSSNIVRLRKEKGITQEALAEFAGVTKASVSKWETGMTMPDIQLLPILATFFDVSVDELIGYEAQLSQKQIREHYHRLAREFSEKDFNEVWEESKEIVKKYYSCYPFLIQIAILWLNHSTLAGTEELKKDILQQTEELCTRIMENSVISGLCENAAAIRSLVWLQQGRPQEIIDLLEKEALDVNKIGDKSAILPMAYMSVGNMEMAEKSSQIGIYRNLMELMSNCLYLLMCSQRDEEYCKEIINRMDQLISAFQIEKLNPNAAAGFHYQAAVRLCGFSQTTGGNLDGLVYERLEKFVETVCQLYRDGIRIHSDEFFFRLKDWFDELALGTEGVRDGKIILTDVISSLNHPVFDGLKDKNRMKYLISKLQSIPQ